MSKRRLLFAGLLLLSFVSNAQYNTIKGLFSENVTHSLQFNLAVNGEAFVNFSNTKENEVNFGIPANLAYEVCWDNRFYVRIKYANLLWYTEDRRDSYIDNITYNQVWYDWKAKIREHAFIIAVGKVWAKESGNQ